MGKSLSFSLREIKELSLGFFVPVFINTVVLATGPVTQSNFIEAQKLNCSGRTDYTENSKYILTHSEVRRQMLIYPTPYFCYVFLWCMIFTPAALWYKAWKLNCINRNETYMKVIKLSNSDVSKRVNLRTCLGRQSWVLNRHDSWHVVVKKMGKLKLRRPQSHNICISVKWFFFFFCPYPEAAPSRANLIWF